MQVPSDVYCSLFLLLISLMMAGGSESADKAGDSFQADRCYRAIDTGLERAGAEFKRLRLTRGHFAGGSWNDDVDQWMGKKHRLMRELESHLVAGGYQKTCAIQLLGSPDQVVGRGHRLYPAIVSVYGGEKDLVASDEYLVYYWRGGHDFLFFTSRAGRLIDSGWWSAGE